MKLDVAIRRWVRDKSQEKDIPPITILAPASGNAEEEHAAEEHIEAEHTNGKYVEAEYIEEERAGAEHAEEEYAENASPSWTIEGVDKTKALLQFDGEETFLIVLQSFAKNTPDLIDKIRDCSESQLQDYAVLVHGIKGTCYGICADEVGKQAEALEIAARQGNFPYVADHNAALIKAVGELLERINSVLKETENS